MYLGEQHSAELVVGTLWWLLFDWAESNEKRCRRNVCYHEDIVRASLAKIEQVSILKLHTVIGVCVTNVYVCTCICFWVMGDNCLGSLGAV